jgi:hypothetical protein
VLNDVIADGDAAGPFRRASIQAKLIGFRRVDPFEASNKKGRTKRPSR